MQQHSTYFSLGHKRPHTHSTRDESTAHVTNPTHTLLAFSATPRFAAARSAPIVWRTAATGCDSSAPSSCARTKSRKAACACAISASTPNRARCDEDREEEEKEPTLENGNVRKQFKTKHAPEQRATRHIANSKALTRQHDAQITHTDICAPIARRARPRWPSWRPAAAAARPPPASARACRT